jgi:hypothetical protein
MKRSVYILTLILSSVLVVNQVDADNYSMPDKAELEAALEACFSSLEAEGSNDQSAMESCMSAKGFTRPSGRGPGNGQGRSPSDR